MIHVSKSQARCTIETHVTAHPTLQFLRHNFVTTVEKWQIAVLFLGDQYPQKSGPVRTEP